ncbi:MAG: polysaccharide deacetylase family protein [Clostridia bacterium]|nr:polysaccharide deacetylase family protein [Clostridia bacterium]
MKRVLAGGLLCVLLLCLGCARPQTPLLFAPLDTPVPPAMSAPPQPSPSPSPVLTPTPSPSPTPMIGDAWYAVRTEQMRTQMRRYGQYPSEEAIEAQLALWEIDPTRPMIALTFDDGPVPGITDRILDILARYNLRATFFVKGIHVEKGTDILRRAVAQGCEIGNHTWNHKILTDLSVQSICSQINKTNEAIYAAVGVETHILRPPGGSCNGYVYTAAKRCDMAVVRWSQSGNVKLTDPAEIAATVMLQKVNGKALQDGDIVLLHDTHEYMIEAVELMIPMILAEGYQFVTVTEILMLSERGLVYGERYDSRYSEH